MLLVDFKALPPIYLTKTAKTIYLILLGILVGIIINFIRVRNRLKNERAEKVWVIEQTRQKMDFYANIHHEFTAPLSNIIVPVSNMMISKKGNQLKSELETIQLNAMKRN